MSFASVTGFAARHGHPALPPQTPPVFTSPPAIVGTATVGQTLSYTSGIYTGNPNPSISQHWVRDGVDIASAINATYTLVLADVGTSITLRQTATNLLGSVNSSSAGVTVGGAASLGAQFSSLSVRAGTAGTYPYSATVLPLVGVVPFGSQVGSTDDASMRSSILSTHSDGSAAVVVVAGSITVTTNQSRSLALNVAAGGAGAALTTSAISALVSNVSVAFGATYGTASISSFTTPERTWWSNNQVICARYRVAAPFGGTSLEAVIDIHAYSGRALVEVVVENCRMSSASPTKPVAASYTSAVVSVNGSTLATVNGNGGPEGSHAALRSWYASTWIGGDPGLRVTQLYTDLQQHPLLFKCARANTADMSVYTDVYTPWATLRQRATNMGGTGDSPSLGSLPLWESHFLASGDYRAAKATEANALAILGYNVNYRDSTTGLVPEQTQLVGKAQGGSTQNWPRQQPGGGSGAMEWEAAHQPAAGLMAFICRPSPVYIELAQKICVWNATWSGEAGNIAGWPGSGGEVWGNTDYTGVFGNPFQFRARAWSMRALAHATFLSPDGSAWKAGGKYWLDRNRFYLSAWTTDSKALLNFMWESGPTDVEDIEKGANAGFQAAVWEYHWLICELHKIASMGLLTGSQQTAFNALADWCALQPVRWVNEQANGGWRYISYETTTGRSETALDSLSTWGAMRAWKITDQPPSVAGGFFTDIEQTTYAAWAGPVAPGVSRLNYPDNWWQAFVAAMERQVTGYQSAWVTVQNNLTGLSAWLDYFSTDPRQGAYPKVVPVSFGAGATTGSIASNAWTPGRDASGVVNQVSWDLVPSGRWTSVVGTTFFNLDAMVKATPGYSGWQDYGTSGFDWDATLMVWVGAAHDPLNARMWVPVPGGHAASSNNGVYRFDAYKMKWAIENLPSLGARVQYKGGYTGDPDAVTATNTKYNAGTLGAINDTAYDQIPADGKPTSRHTYHSLVYMADRREIGMACRRLWTYSLDSGAWNYKRLPQDVLAGALYPSDTGADTSGMLAENIFSMYDETNGDILLSNYGSSGAINHFKFNIRTKTWGTFSGSPAQGWALGGTVRYGRNVTFVRPPGSNAFDGRGEYGVYNLDTRTTTATGSFASGSGGGNFDLGYYMPALIYVPSTNRYWFLASKLGQGTMAWYEIDPTTTPWTLTAKTFAGDVPFPIAAAEPGNKHMFIPSMNAVMFFFRGAADPSGRIYIYKF